MSTSTTYRVTGMTCEHCVAAVSGEVTKLPGVTEVQVDLDTGTVAVTSDQPLSDADVARAVDDAGYRIDEP